jgi:hypothetical protein
MASLASLDLLKRGPITVEKRLMPIADELTKLDALRQSGVLSQEEFDAEKAKLLVGVLVSSGPSMLQAGPLPPATVRSQPTLDAPTSVAEAAERRSNKSLLVVLGVVVLIGVAIGTVFIVKGSASRSKAAQQTAAESNLQNALTGAMTYFTDSNQTYTGLTTPSASTSDIQQIGTGLAYVPGSTASTGPGTISVATGGGGAVVEMVAYAPSSGACYGILQVTSALGQPYFVNYPQTAATGTYAFASQQASAGGCDANLSSPDTLSSINSLVP